MLGSLLFFLYLSSKLQAIILAPLELKNPGVVEISITGEVARPGKYLVERGTVLKTILKRAKCKKFADLSAINGEERVESNREVQIKKLTHILVKVMDTASGNLEFQVPVGMRRCDLSKIHFVSEIDPVFFKSKKRLLPGEIIFIKKKKESLEENK